MPVKKHRILRKEKGPKEVFKKHLELLKMLDAVEGVKKGAHPLVRKEEQLREAVQVSSNYPFMKERIEQTARVLYRDLKRQALKLTGWNEEKADRLVKEYLLDVIREEYKRKGKRLPKGMKQKIESLGE